MGDHALANSYFASHSTRLNIVTTGTQGQILPQILVCSHTKVKSSMQATEKSTGTEMPFISLQKTIASGFLLLSSSPLKFLDCVLLKGQTTAP